MTRYLKPSWRILWYCALIWILTFLVSGVVLLPWFYIILPLVVLLATVYYLDNKNVPGENLLAVGIGASIAWFFALILISFFEVAKFYYFDLAFYFSDSRNWLLYPVVLLVPVVYAIILDNGRVRRSKKRRRQLTSKIDIRHSSF